MRRLLMLGCGGHARVLLDALECGGAKVDAYLAPEPAQHLWPSSIAYRGADGALAQLDPEAWHLVNGVGSTRSLAIRRGVYQHGKTLGYAYRTVTHPSALVAASVRLGEGVQLMAGAIIQCGSVIGADSIVNTGAIVDHDCEIGPHVHLAPGACVAGGVKIGDSTHVGLGARILQNINIGAGCLIAAGAVVIADVPSGTAVAGVPARAMQRREP
jgi:sugar O-acyltransferase (sialic acid O-acetyltransferase NeuD family)